LLVAFVAALTTYFDPPRGTFSVAERANTMTCFANAPYLSFI